MRIALASPPLPSDKGVPLLSQNRQFQWFHTPTFIYPVVPACAATQARRAGHEVPVSPLLPELMAAVESLTREMWPGISVFPVMDPWATDSLSLRRAGLPCYGVSGLFGELDVGNAHGANERLPVEAYYESVEFLHRLVKTLAR